MTKEQIILLVAGILLFDAVTLTVALRWAKVKSQKLAEAIRYSVERDGEKLVLGPQTAMYSGSNGKFGFVKGNGVMALTDKRLIFCKVIGSSIDIPFTDIQSVEENKWFQGSFRNFQNHLILNLRDGIQIGFLVRNHDEWMQAMRNAESGNV